MPRPGPAPKLTSARDATAGPLQAGSGGARLRVSLWPQWLRWLPMAWSDYWILHVDDGYSEALVGSPARDFLWLLAREPGLTPERLQRLVQIARDRGFAVEQLHFDSSV